MGEGPKDKPEPQLHLEYGHAGPYFDKPSTSAFWFTLGFALAAVPILMIGFMLYDLDTIVMVNHTGYTQPPWHNYPAIGFFVLLTGASVLGVPRFRKSPQPVRYVLLGFMVGGGLVALLEGLCFGAK